MPPLRRPVALAALLAVLLPGCHDPTLHESSPPPYLLVEKGPYQSFYGADGKIERLVYDGNGDRVADAVILYASDGTVREAQIDSDVDQVIDRWEYFENGVLVRVGHTRRQPGIPDYWDVVEPDGTISRREYDHDRGGNEAGRTVIVP